MRKDIRSAASALVLAVCAAGSLALFASNAAVAEETPKDALAAELRAQGFPCETAKSATRDEKESAPNEVVWVLTCESAVYRMRVVPDMGAKIERLPN